MHILVVLNDDRQLHLKQQSQLLYDRRFRWYRPVTRRVRQPRCTHRGARTTTTAVVPSTPPRCFGLRALVADVFRAPCAPQWPRDCAEVSTCWTAGGAPRNCTCDPTVADGSPSVACVLEKSENPISCLSKILLTCILLYLLSERESIWLHVWITILLWFFELG